MKYPKIIQARMGSSGYQYVYATLYSSLKTYNNYGKKKNKRKKEPERSSRINAPFRGHFIDYYIKNRCNDDKEGYPSENCFQM